MRKLILIPALLFSLSSCINSERPSAESDEILAQIDSLEAILFSDSKEPADPNSGMMLVRNYAKYYQENKTDSMAIDMLFKAGEVSMGIGQGNLAVKYFNTISKDHKAFYKAPESLFLSGFCEENLNNDTASARFYYEKFLDTYPKHKLAEDAMFSLQNMKMSDEELIEMFEKKLNTDA